jgi:hypothetical protein
MAASPKAGRHGLRLTLPGAPETYHTVQGVLGYFHPVKATPVGGPGELSLEVARTLDQTEGLYLSLVPMTDDEADASNAALTAHRKAAGRYIAEAVKAGGPEGQIARDELAMSKAVVADPKED